MQKVAVAIDEDVRRRADDLFDGALVWDNVWPVDLKNGVSVGNDWSQLERFATAGIDVLGITLAGDNDNVARAVELVAWARRCLREHADRYVLVDGISDVQRARDAGKLALVLHFEGTRCFERNLDLIEVYYALGIRQTILAFNNPNSVGGGCAEEDSGLTKFGRRFVTELQSVGMLVDLSHVGHRTSMEALEMATRPMVFTHSNAYALCPSFRNVRDDQVKACAATGGLVGVSGASSYLGDPECRTETLFRHVDHYSELVGSEHVGLGLDVVYDADALNAYVRGRPDEWPIVRDPDWKGFRYAMPEQVRELTAVMLAHGFRDQDVLNVLGQNYLRIARSSWHDG